MKTTVSFAIPVQEQIQAVERLMRSQLDKYDPDIGNSLENILSSGGKRVRPTISLLVGCMLGAPLEPLISLAAAIEMLHTATLVHDDLIDQSLIRRGNPTLNSQLAAGATVLVGDFLFSRAAEMAADANSIPAMKMFAKTLTTIVEGEIRQLLQGRKNINREHYYQRIYAKTASLFETSACAPALISSVNKDVVEIMRQYGNVIGMAFQIIDDILDFTSTEEALGKPVGSDLRQGLVTLPTLYYVEKHPDDQDVLGLLNGNFPENDLQLERLIQAIASSEAIRFAYQEAVRLSQQGIQLLSTLPDCIERQSLEEIARYIVERNI